MTRTLGDARECLNEGREVVRLEASANDLIRYDRRAAELREQLDADFGVSGTDMKTAIISDRAVLSPQAEEKLRQLEVFKTNILISPSR
jgi:hypothetical protein